MQPEEIYLTFDGVLAKMYRPFCQFPLPSARNYQAIMLIGLLYKESLNLEEIMKVAGHKMNEHALEAFRQEIGRNYADIMRFKAGIEN